MLSAQEGTGSTLPSGNYTAKQGYDFEICFSENPAYSFVKWTAVSRTDSKTEITEGITFEDEKSPVTNVKITNLSDSIKIVPLCEKRIEVYGEPNPRYEPIGVSRDRSITVNFTKELAVENFFFDETEIPADAEEIKKDEEGKIWAYVYEGQTYLKNVSITNSDDYSIAEHFTCPVVEGKLLSIGVDKTNPIKFNVGENFKTVKVSLSKNITDTLGIKMNAEKSWNYQITESTDEKATVTLTSVAAEGSVYLAGTKDYSLGQKITLSFTEDADYQFIKWDYDSSIIFVAEPESANTIATVLDKTSGEDSTQIKAVCAPRLRVTEYSPVTDGATQTVCKNSSIVISFNHKLPTSEEDLAQLLNISITIGGAPVKSSFKAPVINEDTITFAADNSNMLDVPAGQKKTVSVTVPADFYYTLEDGTKITYGGNGKSFDYKIDDTTLDKAEITFTAANGSGELTAASGTKKYSIGQEVPLVFVPADGWTFNGWSVMCGGQPVDESKIKIADVNALSTKLTVYEALTGVTVRAKTSRCLEISETSPAAQTNPKDSSIIIKFNQKLAAECASASMLNKIEISSDVKLDSYYTKRTLIDDTITIENTSPLSVPKGTTKVITVTVPSDFYYENEGNKINLTEKSFSFKIDYTTNAKAKVTYQIINGETDSAFSPADVAGTIEGLESAYQEYNIGEDAELSFALNLGYQFYGWKLTNADSANGLISNQVSFKDSSSKDLQPTLVFNKPINNLVVNVICYKRPVVISKAPFKENSSDTCAKNETIEIGFDHKIDAGTENEIVVGYSISSFSKSTYYETSLNSTQDKITLKPIKMLPVEKAYETVTVTVPCEKVYYLAKDGKTKITPADNDYTWSFRVNNSTIDKTVVRMDSTDASGSVIKVNGDDFSTGDKQTVYMEQSINLEYPVPAGYAFSGWKIVAESDDYTITPAGYVTSGEITVKKDNVEYCKLIINSEASRKAVFSSTDAIGSGAGGHAITVSVRDVLLPKLETFTPAASVNPKDSEITISFNKELAENCSSLLDKIKITMDGNNVDSFFEDRSLSGNTISIKNTGLLDVTGTAKKTITVTVPAIFYYMDGNSQVYLAEEKSFEYKVDSSTKAKIGIRFDSHENSTKKINVNGAETNNGTKGTYNLGETVNLEYALPGDYKFVGWKIVAVSSDYTVTPSNYVTSGTIALKKDDVTYFTLKIDESNPTKAVVQAFGEVENNSNDYGLSVLTKDVVLPAIIETTPAASVVSPKSSTIKIKFNQALAAECSTLLDKIKITMDGNTVDDFFENRSLSGDTITIKNTKLLNITGKTTKTINVTVPAIFYYLEGNLKVTLPEEKTFSYKVDANTVEKVNIHFDSAASSVKKISVNETEKQHNSDGEFNIGEIVNLEYALPGDYKFAGWKVAAEESYTVTPANYVTSGTITVEKDDKTYFTLTIDEKNSAKAVIQTLEKLEEPVDGYALTVYAKDVELPAITATTPSAATNPKDSVITITFNKALDAEFSNSDILKKIKITMDGSNVDSFFENRTLSTDRKTISIKNTKLLNVTGNENKNIEVTIPANVFYYKDGDLKVYLPEEKTVSYKVDSSTTNKTTIRFDSSENSIQKLKVNETDVTDGTSKAYNRGETIKLEYAVPATYKFAGWKLTPATNAYTANPSGYVTSGTITVSKNQIPYLTLKIDADNPAKAVVESYEAVENGTGDYGVSVSTKDVVLPSITTTTPSAATNPKDSAITITFNKSLATECNNSEILKKIKITMDGNNVDSFFETRTLSGSKITINNTKLLDVTGGLTKTVTVTVPANVFYYNADGLNVYMAEEKAFSYKVDASTTSKTKIRFDSSDNSNKQIYANEMSNTDGATATYNRGDIVNLEYKVPAGYKFAGWKIIPISGYTVSSSDYVTSGTISVSKNSKTYLTLKVDADNPSKAVLESFEAVENGTSYGLTIAAKDVLLPKITSFTPDYAPGGVDCDTPISITFNKAIQASSVTVGRTGTVQIVDNSNESEHYESYYKSNSITWSGNTVTIKPNYTIQELVANGLGPKTLKVKFNLSNINDSDGNSLTSSPEYFTYRINGEMEKEIPEWYSNQTLYSDNTSSKKTLSSTSFSSWSSAASGSYKNGTYSQNHVGNSVYYTMYGYDLNSGVKSLRITETYYRSDTGATVTSTPVVFEKTGTYYSSSYNGIYKFEGTYTFKTQATGVIKLDFQLIDNAGNPSTSKTWYVIKDNNVKMDNIYPYVSNMRRPSNNTDDVTVTVHSGLEQDKFYKDFWGDISVEFYWGYSTDSMTKLSPSLIDTYENKYSFSRKADKLTYMKLIATDEAGNTMTSYFHIPPIYGVSSITSKDGRNGTKWFTVTPFNASYYDNISASVGAKQLKAGYFIIEAGKTISWENSINYNTDDASYVSFDDYGMQSGKTYYVYFYITFEYANGVRVFSSWSESYGQIVVGKDANGVNTYTTSIVTPNTGTMSTGSYFDDPVYVNTTAVKGSGCYTVDVDLDKSTNVKNGLKNYWYSMEATNDTTGEVFYNNGTSINLPSPGQYHLYMIVRNSGGATKKSSWLYCCENGSSTYSTSYSLKFTADLTPPDMGYRYYDVRDTMKYSPPTSLNLIYEEDTSASTKIYHNYPVDADSSINSTIYYYILPGGITYCDDSVLAGYTRKKWTFNKDQITWSLPHASTKRQGIITLPYGDIDEGSYTVCVIAQDAKGNETRRFIPVTNRLANESLSWSYNASTKKLTSSNSCSLYYYDTEQSRWIYVDDTNAYGRWCRIVGYDYYKGYYNVEYAYLGTKYTCNNKNIMELQNGLQVFCDQNQTTFVHTLYSTKKLTEKNTASDIAIWETKGTETGVKITSSNFTYGSENLSSVPSGCYYTTVVHFMDGTKLMTEVKQK